MKKTIAVAVLVVALAFTASAFAAPRMGMGGWGMGTTYGRMYNPQTVETISGEVVKVEKITPMKGMSNGIHILVKTDTGETSVHLGPSWYIDKQDTKIAVGDKVVVKGSKVDISGKPAVIAAEVQKDDEVLKLRDDNGYPAWAGWRKR